MEKIERTGRELRNFVEACPITTGSLIGTVTTLPLFGSPQYIALSIPIYHILIRYELKKHAHEEFREKYPELYEIMKSKKSK